MLRGVALPEVNGAMSPILIVESPGISDLRSQSLEGTLLSSQLRLLGIEARLEVVGRKTELLECLRDYGPGCNLFHLSGHGSSSQFGFTDGSALTWQEIAVATRILGDRIVAISACHSASASLVPLDGLLDRLFSAAGIGPPRCVLTLLGAVPIPATVLSWSLFYHHLLLSLAKANIRASDCPPEIIESALTRVKAAELGPKICCAYWKAGEAAPRDISPWRLR